MHRCYTNNDNKKCSADLMNFNKSVWAPTFCILIKYYQIRCIAALLYNANNKVKSEKSQNGIINKHETKMSSTQCLTSLFTTLRFYFIYFYFFSSFFGITYYIMEMFPLTINLLEDQVFVPIRVESRYMRLPYHDLSTSVQCWSTVILNCSQIFGVLS